SRERDRADGGGPRPTPRARLDAQRNGPDRRGEDVEVRREHLPALGGDRALRRAGGGCLSGLGALPPAPRLLGRGRRRSSIVPTPSATSWPRWAGRSATRPAAPGSCGAPDVPDREWIYGRRPVAEAERGRRRVHRILRAPET